MGDYFPKTSPPLRSVERKDINTPTKAEVPPARSLTGAVPKLLGQGLETSSFHTQKAIHHTSPADLDRAKERWWGTRRDGDLGWGGVLWGGGHAFSWCRFKTPDSVLKVVGFHIHVETLDATFSSHSNPLFSRP